jgi:phosphomannomutase
MGNLDCFKAYDIRGRLGDELNEGIAYRIGRAYAEIIKPQRVVVGGDVRLTSESLKLALAEGLRDAGCNVLDIGVCGTEEIYFATSHLKADGGIVVTASHNPLDYNGMKLVRKDSRPISGDTGLKDIQQLAELNQFSDVVSGNRGSYSKISVVNDYIDHLFEYIAPEKLKPLRLVVNAGNGAAGHVIDLLEGRFARMDVPVQFIKIHHEPDGNFPNGIPNPLLPENRLATADAVLEHKADMGIAWDGDFDRCFLFDEKGQFIEGYYIVGLLAEAFLVKNKGGKIVHDPRLTWNTIDVVEKNGGLPILSKTGHAFIKERMRMEDAVYGGEMSAHHYFRDFAYCDSGMIPWLLVTDLLCTTGKSLSTLVEERMAAFPCSGEINYQVNDAKQVIEKIREYFSSSCVHQDETDGLSMEFSDWRFNVRMSNTESLLRLNVETRGLERLVCDKVQEIENLIQGTC